jgi:hypothetical protein
MLVGFGAKASRCRSGRVGGRAGERAGLRRGTDAAENSSHVAHPRRRTGTVRTTVRGSRDHERARRIRTVHTVWRACGRSSAREDPSDLRGRLPPYDAHADPVGRCPQPVHTSSHARPQAPVDDRVDGRRSSTYGRCCEVPSHGPRDRSTGKGAGRRHRAGDLAFSGATSEFSGATSQFSRATSEFSGATSERWRRPNDPTSRPGIARGAG